MNVREIAARVADDICMFGHYQSKRDQHANDPQNPTGVCCVLLNPTFEELTAQEAVAFRNTLMDAGAALDGDIGDWNDETPTEEVVSELRAIATGA